MSNHAMRLAACIAMLMLLTLAGTAQAQKPGKPPNGQGPAGQGPAGAGQMQVLPQIAFMFDANGNGQLDADEQQKALQYMQQMQAAGGMPGGQGPGGQGPGGQPPGGQGPGGGRGPGGRGPGGQGGGMNLAAMMNNPQMQQQILQRFDANGNGQLDPDEQRAAMQALQQMQGGQGPGGQGPGGRGPGGQGGAGGGMNLDTMMNNPQMRQQILGRFDANGNGQLDPDEHQAAQQALQQMQGGQGGAGGQGAAGGGMNLAAMMNNPQMQQQILQRFDKNGNGQLDPDEQQAALQAYQQFQAGQSGAGGANGQGPNGQPPPAGVPGRGLKPKKNQQ